MKIEPPSQPALIEAELEADDSVHAKLQPQKKIRLLVVIASYGEKNLDYLKSIIRGYQDMDMQVDVRVVSEAAKDLGPDVKVTVGLPSKNPWSLPFAHKAIFAREVEAHDLFIYSEDDMAVSEKNLRAFLELVPQLEPDEIAGYLRYEMDSTGAKSFPEAHGVHHWKPESIRRRGSHTIAEFTNEHAAFYVLTRQQLKQAIASGGFLREPYAGKYDMLCSAATDPYTSCGFKKVIPISSPEDFSIHHLPNRYSGQFGISLLEFKEQIETLQRIAATNEPRASLGISASRFQNGRWSKSYHEPEDPILLSRIPAEARTILSVGCGCGASEIALVKAGKKVTALPLDAVIGSHAEMNGVSMIYGTIQDGLRQLGTQAFDCVLITNLLHLIAEPAKVIADCGKVIHNGGTVLIAGPNFSRIPILLKKQFGIGDYRTLRDFSNSGINAFNTSQLSTWLRQAGFAPGKPLWSSPGNDGPISGAHGRLKLLRRQLIRGMLRCLGNRFKAEGWYLASKKIRPSQD